MVTSPTPEIWVEVHYWIALGKKIGPSNIFKRSNPNEQGKALLIDIKDEKKMHKIIKNFEDERKRGVKKIKMVVLSYNCYILTWMNLNYQRRLYKEACYTL